MRYFFARWVESTGVPEFAVEYQIIRTRAGKFRARGTIKQNFENLRMPVELLLRTEGDDRTTELTIVDKSEDFDLESNGKPLEVVIDPNNKILRSSDELRISVVARRGLELFREGSYLEAQRQLEEALKLDKSNSWVYYNLGLLYLEQRNYQQALDNFLAALQGKPQARLDRSVGAHQTRQRLRRARATAPAPSTNTRRPSSRASITTTPSASPSSFIDTPYDPKSTQAQVTSN